MKKISVILVVILLSVVLAIAIGIVPFVMSLNSIDKMSDPRTDECISAFYDIVYNDEVSDDIKEDACFMYGSLFNYIGKVSVSEFGIVIYLLAVTSIILLLFGVYFIKNKWCKNYIGAIFIVAACILLAFTVVFGSQILIINNNMMNIFNEEDYFASSFDFYSKIFMI